jgi:hypothetical protein
MTTLRIVSLFNKDLRGLLQVAPDYMKPVRYDARKLEGLLGPPKMTSYDAGIYRKRLPRESPPCVARRRVYREQRRSTLYFRGIREEHLDRLALIGALAAQIGVEIATHLKLIELVLRHHNRPPKQIMLAALAMPGDRLADLFLAGRHAAASAGRT